MILYRTVTGPGTAEQTIEKSRFICYVSPASTREEAEEFFAEIRKRHRDATHNVPAMVLGDQMQIQWGSDDGEPQGTSGAPIVQMLVSMGITNVAVMVTRYFGGIKLGTGGLVRAYTSSAKLGIEAAGTGKVLEAEEAETEIEYPYFAKVQNAAGTLFDIVSAAYGEKVKLILAYDPEKRGEVIALLDNLTNGTKKIIDFSKKLLTKPE